MEGLPEDNIPVASPSSEVGCDPRSAPQPTMNNSEEKWKLILEQQNQNFLALIQAIKQPTTSGKVHLPTFDPEKTSVDARAWLSTADMCMADQPLSGAPLMIALSEALKGEASAWLSQVSFPGMTWKDFQEAFTARYDISETAASTLINLYNSKPKEGECLATYAATQLNILMSRWKKLNTEQIAISTVMAHIAQIEPRVNRVAFTTEIETRTKLQQELRALSYMKRKAPTSDYNNDTDPKQRKLMSTPVKCAHCGRLGHHVSACRLRKDNRSTGAPPGEANKPATTSKPATTDITCFNCRGAGHYASRCPRAASTEAKSTAVSTTSKPVERRVEVCAVSAPMGVLEHFVCLTITWAEAQNGRGSQHQEHNGHGWDIRLAVPGEPGSDYPTLGAIPRTSFSCAGREPGYYADLEANCQVFRVCTVGSTYGFQSFLCPNGTLFNQAVFVCDWWMNVDCQNSQKFDNNNKEQFENLRLGPQLMKDIKKMLTHPMLNPYDKNAMKSNLIVMQDYKPPFGQLFPNGALLAGPERAPNNVYVPAKQIQQNLIQGNQNDFTYSASTPDPRYVPAPINSNFLPLQRDAEIFQRQRQNGQYNAANGIQNARVQTTQTSQTGNFISNGHAGRFLQNGNTNLENSNGYSQAQVQAPRPTQISNNFSQRQTSSVSTSQLSNAQNTQRGQVNKQRSQYSEPRRLPQTNNEAQFAKLQNSQNNNQGKQPYTYSTPASNTPQFSNNINNPAGRELKENLVSTIRDIPSTVITKTLTYSRVIQEPKVGKPKSRITVKTWIVKPTKSARLIVEPTPYTYARPSARLPPSPSPTERIIEENTPYVYDVPTTSSNTEKIISPELESESSEEPYVYTRPTPSAKQVQTTEIETTRIYIAPTTLPTRSTFSERITNFPQTSPLPTKASRLYLTPSPFTSTARFYLPPPQNPTTLPRLYLPQNVQQPIYYQSSQIRAAPTIPTPTRVPFNENLNQPSFSVTKQSRVNANRQNLTFTDILTKEKLDITVNDIVKDTNDILKTASPPQYSQYQNHKEFKSLGYPDNYLASRMTIDSGETLTSQVPIQTPTMSTKSSRIIVTPATSLQPPNENFIYQNSNQLSNLPFFKETGIPNTIERTVSIKITIPERIAAFLFKNRSDSDFDKLEILNTGSSNYLVMSNNFIPKKNAFNFIPIAKLIGNENSNNLSDSQALVYSFLTDSINVAREYNNIAQRDIKSSTASPALAQFKNLNNDKLSQITNQISQLTSSQYSSNNLNSFGTNANIISTQRSNTNQPNQFTGNAKYTDGSNQPQQIQTNQLTPSQQTQGNFYSSRFQVPSTQQNLLNSQNQLYSGQLYQWSVPDVTNQVYNSPSPANLVNPSNIQQQTTQMLSLQQNTNQNNAVDNFKQSNPQFEVVKAETVDLNPAKLQLEPPKETEQFGSQETLNSLLNSGNGISAHLEDKIVGTIPHPLEDNKVLTYKKDQSYYLYTKLEDNTIGENSPTNQQLNTNTEQNAKLIESTNNNMPKNVVSFQLIPSVSYEVEDEKDQQTFLNAFQIDEFGAPRDITRPQKPENQNNDQGQQIMTSSVDFSVEHPTTAKQNQQYSINPLYSGPSSYTAPQSSVGSLGSRQVAQNSFNSRLEDFDSSNNKGYPKERPARQFFPTYTSQG